MIKRSQVVGIEINPKLLGVDLLLIDNARPRRMFACFLLGGMGMALTVGLLDVFVLKSDTISTQGSASAGLDLVLGVPLVVIGVLLATGRLHGRRKAPAPAGAVTVPAGAGAGTGRGQAQPPKKEGWAQRVLREPRPGLAVLVGDPRQEGPYLVRVKVPAGTKLMPHRHPEDRLYTVMSGVFYTGLGERFDGDAVKAYPPGSVIVLPGDTWHFHWAKSGEYVTQVSAIGPLGLDYHDPEDDPRNSG